MKKKIKMPADWKAEYVPPLVLEVPARRDSARRDNWSEKQIAQELAPFPSTAPPDVVITEKPRVPAVWVSAHYTLGKEWRSLPAETPVIVVRDNGSVLETWTLRTPRELGGQPVVDCEGISGPYHLRNIYVRAKR